MTSQAIFPKQRQRQTEANRHEVPIPERVSRLDAHDSGGSPQKLRLLRRGGSEPAGTIVGYIAVAPGHVDQELLLGDVDAELTTR